MSLLSAQIKTEGKCPSDIARFSFKDECITDPFDGQTLIKIEPSSYSSVISDYNQSEQNAEDISALERTEPLGSRRNLNPSPDLIKSNDSSTNDYLDFACERNGSETKRFSLIKTQRSIENQAYKCQHCDKSFESLSILSDHQLCHLKNKLYPCNECHKTFLNKSRLIAHSVCHSPDQPFQCKKCDKSFKRKKTLSRHEEIHSGSQQFQCHLCQNTFKNKENLDVHVTAHLNSQLFQCLLCQKTFMSKHSLSVHGRAHSNEKPYPCHLCEKSFKNKTHRLQHQTVHSNDKPFQCKQCGKSFKRKTRLIYHERTHSVPKRFQCYLCDEFFPNEETLTFHAQYHTIKTRYSCEMCEKSFEFKRQLRLHSAVHSDYRPFKCSMCEKPFKSKLALKAHYKCHSDNRPFKCDKCDRSFKRKNALCSHINRTHKSSQNMSLLSVKTAVDYPPENAHETIVGLEFDDITDCIGGQTPLNQEPSNCPPVVVIKQEPEDIHDSKNTEQPRRSTTHKTETNDIKYEDITHTVNVQTLIKQEPFNCSPVVLIKQESKDMFAFKNHEQPRKLPTQKLTKHTTKTNDIKYEDITNVIALQKSIKQEQ